MPLIDKETHVVFSYREFEGVDDQNLPDQPVQVELRYKTSYPNGKQLVSYTITLPWADPRDNFVGRTTRKIHEDEDPTEALGHAIIRAYQMGWRDSAAGNFGPRRKNQRRSDNDLPF